MHLALVQALYRARCNPEFAQISIHGAVHNCSRGFSLQVRPRRYAFRTDPGFTLSGSTSPLLPFHMHFALVQTLCRARFSPEFAQISIHGAICNCSRGGSLLVRHRWCAFCTDPGFRFSASPSPLLPFHMHLTLVETLYRTRYSPNLRKFPFTAQGVIAA